MTTPLTAFQIEQLKRAAKKLARTESIRLYEAQHRLAVEHGYANWSLLHKHSMSAVNGAPSASQAPRAKLANKDAAAIVVGSRSRQYLHGDQHEVHLNRFYCRSCDDFVAAEHFFEKHDRRETLERALNALTQWYLPSTERAYTRPDNAQNMLEDEARREAVVFQNSRSPFYRWLERRMAKDSPIGDLAVDVLRDRKFPVDVSSADEAVSYLKSRTASEAAVKTMKQAWRQFEAGQKRSA
ncbi:YozE family protein [Delftia sp. ASV31]|uniref:YozE family protein n=1 Tax=Delftia sp. ASV31 TaxID=2795113 RepID=UPI0018EB3C7A|nr:YozE family protein [Delftia sp. ASV31]